MPLPAPERHRRTSKTDGAPWPRTEHFSQEPRGTRAPLLATRDKGLTPQCRRNRPPVWWGPSYHGGRERHSVRWVTVSRWSVCVVWIRPLLELQNGQKKKKDPKHATYRPLAGARGRGMGLACAGASNMEKKKNQKKGPHRPPGWCRGRGA